MKVLFVAPRCNDTAGDGVYVKRLALALVNKGVQIEIIYGDGSKLVHIKYRQNIPNALNANLSVREEIGTIDSGVWARNFYSQEARSGLKNVLEVSRPDLIHIHGIHQFFTLSCLFELRQYGAPTVLTVHDYKIVCGNAGFFSDRTETPCTKCLTGSISPPFFERCKKNSAVASAGAAIQMATWKYSNALDAVDTFLVGSSFVFDLLSRNRSLADRLRLCRFPYHQLECPNPDDSNKQVSLSFIGRFVPHKGVLIFAQSVSEFQVPIHLFGDGNLLECTKFILQNNRNVTFHGWTSQKEIAKHLSLGTIVVVPSLAYETFCYVVVEAMMRGCCVVASSRGAIPELIQDGYNGVIVDPPTAEGFLYAVKMLLANRDRIITLGRRAKCITTSLPSIDAHADEVISVYGTLA